MKEVIDQILLEAIEKGASDIHLGSEEPPYIRKDGELSLLQEEVISQKTLEEGFRELMEENLWGRFIKEKELDFSYHIPGKGRFRVNVFLERKGIAASFRIIPEKIIPLEKLGLPSSLQRIVRMERGLILVTGPTGSGKTTTLASLIDLINQTRKAHIITVEDPVEYIFQDKLSLISQREVFIHVSSFQEAIRSALREDPDILMIGELRDRESISLALRAGEMGTLVMASLHTSGAVSTINRIIEVFPPEEQESVRTALSQVLKVIISQQLLRRTDGKGRVPAVEILFITPGIANLIRSGKVEQIPSAMETGRSMGMKDMDESLMALYRAGYITIQEAYQRAKDKTKFEPFLKEMERLSEDLEAGTRDEITGVYSYPYFIKRVEEEVRRGRRYGRKFSLIRLTVEGYFSYLKKEGEIKARFLLKKLAEVLEENVRKVDIVAHSPYENQFVILFPETGEQVEIPQERLKVKLGEYIHSHYPQTNFTFQSRHVRYPEDGEDTETLLKKLYQQ